MLTGRESLVRLIGRRRRSPLPASLAAVLSPSTLVPSASLAQADDGHSSGEAAGGEAGSTSGGSGVVGVGGAEWVACPVCGDSIRGSDYCVNTHLDVCLTRGTKRKLTQSTLLNFRFSKKVSAEPTANNLNNESKTENTKQIDEDLSSDQAFFSFDSEIGSSKAGATISPPTFLNGSLGTSETITSYAPSNTVLPNVKDAVNDGAGEFPTVATSCSIDECAVMDSSTVVIVDTVIVGRRFHENIELREDAVITFQRDPQNAKDPDAIKVLYAGSECEETLGYLPRDLAKILAPLVDRHYVECEFQVLPRCQETKWTSSQAISLACSSCADSNTLVFGISTSKMNLRLNFFCREHPNPRTPMNYCCFNPDSRGHTAVFQLTDQTKAFHINFADDINHSAWYRKAVKFLLQVFGSVVGSREQQFGNVPIQITIQKCKADNQRNDDPNCCQSLWENLVSTVKSENFRRPRSGRYQTNFNLMIADVMANHSHVFSDIEKSFLASCKSLSDDGQRLFIRIYTRKGPWFRKSSISYQEISDLEHAVMELELAGYIDMLSCTIDPSEYDMKEILDVLSVPEMKEILKELPKDNSSCTRRHELVSTLLSSYHNGTCASLPKRILKWTGTCIRISKMADELLWRIQRLFFLNGEQDLSSFLLVEFGVVKFPDYVCSISHRIFQERSDLLEYEDAIRVAQVMDESLDNNNMDLVTRCIDLSETRLCTMPKQENATTPERLPSFFSRLSASWVYSKILTLGVSVYERDRRYEDAIRILKILLGKVACDRRRGYWALRLSVDLEHMGRPNESLSTAEGGTIDPWVRAGSKFALQRRVLRLSKPPRRWKVPSYADYVKRNIREVSIEGRPLNCETGAKNVFYGYDGELCGVEQLALQYYADEGGGWQGTHSEGGIWMTIFGLLMWDVMFSDIQDVFQSKFQTAPLDLETDDFYTSRKEIAESQLKKIQDGMAEEMLISSWELHQGTSCRGVNWVRYSLTDLRAVVACIGGHRLASLLRHLAVDYRSWSSGMPDLLLWRFLDERGGGEAKLVEVKGPRDQLSEQQRAWILVLMDFGFDVEVCKVSPVTKRR